MGLELSRALRHAETIASPEKIEKSWVATDDSILSFEESSRQLRRVYNAILDSVKITDEEKKRRLLNLRRDLNAIIAEYDPSSEKNPD